MAKQPTTAPAPKMMADKIIVGSKLPMSIELQHCRMVEQRRTFRGTAWTEQEAQRHGPVVRIRGTAQPRGIPPDGYIPAQIVSGYALTFGVDSEWFEEWLRQNKQAPFVENGVLIWGEDRSEILAKAKENKAVFSGLDPVRPPVEGQAPSDRDPRLPRSVPGIAFSGTAGPTDADTAA